MTNDEARRTTEEEAAPKDRSLAVITLRVSPWLHRGLKALAWRRKTSLNQLCVQLLDEEFGRAVMEIAETGSSSLVAEGGQER